MSDTLWVVESGIRRRAKLATCGHCGKEFLTARFRRRKYCSKECAYSGARSRVLLLCAQCGKNFKRTPSKTKQSKHNKHFCSRKCKDTAQSWRGNCPEIRPAHYKDGRYEYRAKALELYGPKCAICGYNEITGVLDVHHIDGDRDNGASENLIVLCPTHHVAITRGYAKLVNRRLAKT